MEFQFTAALDTAPWAALLIDDAGDIIRINEAAASVFGVLVDSLPAPFAFIWPRESGSANDFLKKETDRDPVSTRLKVKEGGSRPFAAVVCKIPSQGILIQLFREDIKAPVKVVAPPTPPPPTIVPVTPVPLPAPADAPPTMDTGLAHKQKLDCALQLTRTVALDFNNALTSILGHTSLVLGKMEPNHPWRGSLVEVEKSAEKAAEIAHDLAAFSRQDKDTRSQTAGNLNNVLRRTVDMFKTPGNEQIEWVLNLEPKLYTASFDEAKLQQAFVKIVDNAVQAVGETAVIEVSTRNQDVTTPLQDGTVRLAAGSYVCVEFKDNGEGMAPHVLPRIFEPFFSTKNNPAHRGLGLAWVYGIVTNHGGTISVSSEVGTGTNFRLYLPATRKIAKDRAVKGDDLSGSQTILMIDDEELLLTMGQMVLSSFGYRVLTASSGAKALETFAGMPQEIDLVITDLVMPQMSGRELIEKLRKLSPSVKIICASGYMRPASEDDEEFYLQKPFTSQDLLRIVKNVLSGSETS